jgi:hypothetical protein
MRIKMSLLLTTMPYTRPFFDLFADFVHRGCRKHTKKASKNGVNYAHRQNILHVLDNCYRGFQVDVRWLHTANQTTHHKEWDGFYGNLTQSSPVFLFSRIVGDKSVK